MRRRRVTVVGGGVAGLVAARSLAADCDVTLFEASGHLGGKLQSAVLEGRPVDLGPDAFLTRNPAAEKLCEDLGLGGELLAPSSNSVAMFVRGQLRRLPKGIVLGVPSDLRALAASGVLGPLAVARAAVDLLGLTTVAPADAVELARSGGTDRSVQEILGRPLGRAVVRTLVDPLLGGINASDVEVLSLAAAAPQLLGRIAGKRRVTRALRGEQPTFTGARGRPPFMGLAGGMGALADTLSRACRAVGVELRTSAPVDSIGRTEDGGWAIRAAGVASTADAVLVAAPAFAAAAMLRAVDAPLAEDLAGIPYAGVVTACLAWPASAIPAATTRRLGEIIAANGDGTAGPLPGSGVLAPRDGRRLLSAMTFTSSKWPRSAAPDSVVIRCFAGRHSDERALSLDDGELIGEFRRDLREILGIAEAPRDVVVQRWRDALPQYVTGHLARMRRIGERLDRIGGLALAGAAYGGIGIPTCIDNGLAAAERIRRGLGVG